MERCEARVGVGSSSERPGEGYGSESSIAGSKRPRGSGGMVAPRYDRRSLGKVGGGRIRDRGRLLAAGDAGRGLRWARAPVGEKRVRNAKGKSTWDLFSHTVGKGVRKEYAVETRGSGLGGGRDGLTWKLDGHED